MPLVIQTDNDGKSYVEVVEIVVPDSGVTFPIGPPLPLNDHKAYFFAPKIIRSKPGKAIGAALKDLLDFMQKNKAFGDLLEGDTDDAIADPELFDKAEGYIDKLICTSLAVNYKSETVEKILESGCVDYSHLFLIIAIVGGQTLSYEVRVKKNEGELTLENET